MVGRLILLALVACGSSPDPDAMMMDGGETCVGISGPGVHRLFVQGHEAEPDEHGRWPFLHDHSLCDDSRFVHDDNEDGVWQPGEEPRPLGPPGIVHGEHFLVGPGAFVEFAVTLCGDITGDFTLYIPNFDELGSRARHELFVVHEGEETRIGDAIDEEPGSSGYNPFIRVIEGVDPDVVPGDTLLLRSTNLSGAAFSVMVWRPPSEYESWVLVEVS